MSFRNNLFFLLAGVFSCVGLLFAQSESPSSNQIKLYGDILGLDNSTKMLYASGNVLAEYNDGLLEADEFKYNFHDEILDAPGSFSYRSGNNFLKLHQLHYDGKKLEGSAESIQGNLGRFFIKGDHMSINTKRVVLKNASFTTCDLPDPHYIIETDSLYIYPLFGFLVANNNHLRIRNSPVRLWVPTYFYGSPNYALWNLTPFPRFGSTRREGFYIKQGIPYSVNSQTHGNIDIGYTEKLGPEYSITQLYAFSTTRQLMAKAGSVGKDGFIGGLIYRQDLEKIYGLVKPKSKLGTSLFGTFSDLTHMSRSVLTLESTWANLINNSRVDFTPRVKLEFNKLTVTNTPLEVSSSLEGAYIHENTLKREDINGKRAMFLAQAKYPKQFSKWLRAETTMDTTLNFYQDHDYWRRGYLGISLIPKSPILNPRFSFSKQMFFSGTSPFEFDRTFIQQSDEFGFALSQKIHGLQFDVKAAYRTQTWTARQLEYSMTMFFHDLSLILGYNEVQQSFFFGGSL